MAKILITGVITDLQDEPEQTLTSGRKVSAHKVLVIEETQTNEKTGAIFNYIYEVKFFGNYAKELNVGEGRSIIGANITLIGKCVGKKNDKGYFNYQITGETLIFNSFSRLETPTQEQKAQEIPHQTSPSASEINEDDLPW